VENGNVNIQRTNVSSGSTTTLASFPAGLSDMGAFTVSIADNRWYFHHERNSGTFGGVTETLGFADATFISEASSGDAEAIPTLSFWGLLALITFLVSFGLISRKKSNSFY